MQKINTLISRSIKFAAKRKINASLSIIKSFYFWKWRKNVFLTNEVGNTKVHFLGKSSNLPLVKSLLGASEPSVPMQHDGSDVKCEVQITDFPLPAFICIPATLATIVPLHRTVDDILATYSRSLRRSITGQRAKYRTETIGDLDKITSIEQEMLMPYANARHENAHHLGLDTVVGLATSQYGRLDLLYLDDEAVGCHLGNDYEQNGKRYWHVNRFGYPEKIYSDFKHWGEVNSMNLHLALEKAIKDGYDFIDYGGSLARPGAGLIEWKRRRKGLLTQDHGQYLYLKLPKRGADQFFWESPLFAIEEAQITLHLGVPEQKTNEEVMARYNEMAYGGLYKVYLHCAKTLDETLVESIRALYADQENPPMIITYMDS